VPWGFINIKFRGMKKLYTILVMLAAMNASAQWVQLPNNGLGVYRNVFSLLEVGNNIFAGTSDSGVYISTNNGTSWTHASFFGRDIESIVSIGNNIFAASYGVFVSTNNGINWTNSNVNNNYVHSLYTFGNNVYAGTERDGIFLSTNYGTNWIQTSLSDKVVCAITSIGNYFLAGTAAATNPIGIYLSTNNGINWYQSNLSYKSVGSFAILGNNIFAGAFYNYGVYLSTDYGLNWTQTALNNREILSLGVSGNNIFAGTASYGIYVTSNNGTSWIEKDQGFANTPSVKSFLITNNYIYVGTYGQSIWRRPLSDFVGINNISTEIPDSYSLSQNYPNPFNPTTKIKFAMPKSGVAKIVVYDVMGREVQTLVNERLQAGTYETSFDGSALNSGVYFYKLITDGFTETKRMILIK